MKIISVSKSIKVALILFIMAAVLSAMITCSKDKIVETAPGKVYGVVTDSITLAPIESAAIYPYDIGSAPKYTDSTGYYALPLMPVTGVNVLCLKGGFVEKTRQCNIIASESTRVDFQIVPIVR
jgi:hypothetical protein